MANRTITLPGIVGDGVNTVIPDNPSKGSSYRNTNLSTATLKAGWTYKTVVDSANENQVKYLITYLLQLVEQFGILQWCASTVYPGAGSFVIGKDGLLYIALQASINIDPVDGASRASYWQLYSDYIDAILARKIYVHSTIIHAGKAQAYTIPHNLGSANVKVTIYVSQASNMSSPFILPGGISTTDNANGHGAIIKDITTTQLTIMTGAECVGYYFDNNGKAQHLDSAYYKVIVEKII
jgi:hypothetical protein